MLYHAFQIVTEDAYELHVDQDQATLNSVLVSTSNILTKLGETIETIALGTVEADNVEAALNKVRSDDWQYIRTR